MHLCCFVSEYPLLTAKYSRSSQPHCFWSSGRGTGLLTCASGKCRTGARRRYEPFKDITYSCIIFVRHFGSTRSVITGLHGRNFLVSCVTVGGTDPGDCERCQVCTKNIQALLPAQHSGFDLCHGDGGCYLFFNFLFALLFRHVLRGSVIIDGNMSVCLFPQILVIIGLTHALVVFRVIAAVLLAEGSWEFLSNHSNTGAMMLGAVVHYLIITIMTRVRRPPICACPLSAGSVLRVHPLTPSLSLQVNRIVAMKLCEIGMFTAATVNILMAVMAAR